MAIPINQPAVIKEKEKMSIIKNSDDRSGVDVKQSVNKLISQVCCIII